MRGAWLLVLAGCGDLTGSRGGAPELTCGDSRDMCYDYVGSSWTLEEVRELCDSLGQAGFSGDPCEEEELVGQCQYWPEEDADREIIFYYYAPEHSAESAEEHCDNLGDAGLWLG